MKSYTQFLEGYVASADRKAGKDGKLRPAKHIKTNRRDDEEEMVENYVVKYHDKDGKHVNDSKVMPKDKAQAHADKGNKIDKVGGKYTVHAVNEKMDMKKADMGDVIKDFQDSDAPQFQGKSREKRRQMAIAAKLAAEAVKYYGNPNADDEKRNAARRRRLTKDQHKLDKNKNGKIDADDFKKLRNESAHEELRDYGTKHGGIDKTDFHHVAGKLQHHKETGNPGSLHDAAKHIRNMDTDPRDKVMSIIKKHDPSMHKSLAHKAGLVHKEELQIDEALETRISGGKVPVGQHTLHYKTDKSHNYIKNSIKSRDPDAKVSGKDGHTVVHATAQAHSSVIKSMRDFRVKGVVHDTHASNMKEETMNEGTPDRLAMIRKAAEKVRKQQAAKDKAAMRDAKRGMRSDPVLGKRPTDESVNEAFTQEKQREFVAAARELSNYAMKSGGIDKRDFMDVSKMFQQIARVNILQAGQVLAQLNRKVQSMDTDPRDKVYSILKKHKLMESLEEAVGTAAKHAGKTGFMGGKYSSHDHMVTMKNFSKVRDQRAKQRDAEHKAQDPKHAAAGYAKHMVDTNKAKKKAAARGVDASHLNWKHTNGVKRGKLPENYIMEDAEMEKREMMKTQLHFIKYAAEEIMEYIDMPNSQIEEWYQNKVSKACADFEGLHAYMEGTARKDGLKEATDNPPFTPDPKKKSKPQRNSDGSVTSPMSKAKQLAHQAIKNAEKTVAQHKEGVEFDEEGNLLEANNKITFHQFMGATKKKKEKKGGDNNPLEAE